MKHPEKTDSECCFVRDNVVLADDSQSGILFDDVRQVVQELFRRDFFIEESVEYTEVGDVLVSFHCYLFLVI